MSNEQLFRFMNKQNPLSEKSYAFALKIINTYKLLTNAKREYILSKQLLRSGTSIGANVAEANGAISKADFSAKISIAYKESLETKYWLSILKDSDFIIVKDFQILFEEADELSKILFFNSKIYTHKTKLMTANC